MLSFGSRTNQIFLQPRRQHSGLRPLHQLGNGVPPWGRPPQLKIKSSPKTEIKRVIGGKKKP